MDFVIAAACLALIGALAFLDHLPAWLLLLIVGLSSLSSPLSSSGLRTLYPLMVPRPLWERANAVDSNGYIVASIFGPALAGIVVGLAGGPVALIGTAVFFGVAAVVIRAVPEPPASSQCSGSLLRDAWLGLVHVVIENRSLRGLAVVLSLANIGNGIVTSRFRCWSCSVSTRDPGRSAFSTRRWASPPSSRCSSRDGSTATAASG